jgi:tetratricopeptide (TPR) repeat protein
VVYTDLGDLARAATFTERALRLNRTIGSAVGEAANRATLGDIYRYQGDYGRALSSFTEARALFGSVGDRYGVGNSLRGLATVHHDLGNLSQAREMVEQSLAVQREIGHRRLEVDLRVTLASVQALAGEPGAADDYQGAAALAREGGNRFLEAEALIGLASVQRLLGMLGEAHDHVSQALTIAREATYRLLEGHAHTVLAAVELDLGNPKKATEQARRALSLLRRTGHRPGEARAHLVLSRAAQAAGRPERSRRHEHAAQEIFTALGIPEGIGRTALFGLSVHKCGSFRVISHVEG